MRCVFLQFSMLMHNRQLLAYGAAPADPEVKSRFPPPTPMHLAPSRQLLSL